MTLDVWADDEDLITLGGDFSGIMRTYCDFGEHASVECFDGPAGGRGTIVGTIHAWGTTDVLDERCAAIFEHLDEILDYSEGLTVEGTTVR